MPDHYEEKKKKKTTSQKGVGHLKKEASKRQIGKVIGLNINAAIEKAFNDAFNLWHLATDFSAGTKRRKRKRLRKTNPKSSTTTNA